MPRFMPLLILPALAAFFFAAQSVTPAQWLDPAAPDVDEVLGGDDTQFSWHNGPGGQQEWLNSYGANPRSRIKGFQDVTALKFDLADRRSRVVDAAELHVALGNATEVYALVVSTINADWAEGAGRGGQAAPGEPCWRWRRRPADPDHPAAGDEWAFAHSDFSLAAFGNYGSLVSYGYKASGAFGTYQSGGATWLRMKIDPALIHALIIGDQYGLAVTDPRGYRLDQNPQIYTKDQNNSVRPRLLLKFASTGDTQPPGAVGALRAAPGALDGEVLLSFTAPAAPPVAAFGYNVRVGTTNDYAAATDVARWRIPRPKAAGTPQQILLENLTPGATHYFFVCAYDLIGNSSPVASVSRALSPAQAAPQLPDGGLAAPDPAGKSVREVPGALRYWACPAATKVNPATGNRLADGYGGSGADDYKKANIVWDAAANAIQLRAARNEVASCQLIIERLGATLNNVRVTPGNLAGPGNATIVAVPNLELFQCRYVAHGGARYADPAIPLAAPFPQTFAIPDANHNPTGANQSIWLDLYIPRDAGPGDYAGQLRINADGLAAPVEVNIQLRVSPTTIPDALSFIIDLNGYGSKWDYGAVAQTRLRWFQAHQKHRVSLNTLPYGWNANVNAGRAPTLTGAGPNRAIADWTTFDDQYGALFDGSAFSSENALSPYHGPGADTPVPTFYTTFFESWPTHVLDAAYGFDAAGQGGAHWNNLIDNNPGAFWTDAPDVRGAFTSGYQQGVRNVVKEWFEHAQAKGWHGTNFQIYLNHKYSYNNCAALWTLEECGTADDFRAVGVFHELYRQGAALANAPNVKWHWRIDISDRWGQHYGQLDGRINWSVINGGSADWHWPNLRHRNLHHGREQWAFYGTGPAPQDSGSGLAQRLLRAWAQGLDGGIPYWDNFQTSWDNAEPLSVVYSGQNVPGFGEYGGCIMSVRVKQMRQAQQLIELANLLAAQSGWNREHVTQAIAAKYGDGSWNRAFSGLGDLEIQRLHADLLAALEPKTSTNKAAAKLK